MTDSISFLLPLGEKEGVPAVRYGIIVTPSPNPLPCGARE
jgi:hypothetical protein